VQSNLRVRRDWPVLAVLALLTLALYWQAVGFEFVNYDDPGYVYQNPYVGQGLSLHTTRWAFTTLYQANWHPLTWLSLMADTNVADLAASVFDLDTGKDNAAVYHLTSILLHLANTLLVFIVLCAMTGRRWRSAFVAALFAVHPLHVESVAWVAERKDVLSTLFWLLATLAYVRYARERGRKRYMLVVAAFVCGLLAKPMLVTLPIALLLLDLWPLRRVGFGNEIPETPASLIVEKIPLFALSAASCVVTFFAQRYSGAVGSTLEFPLGVRLANAAVAYTTYIWKMIWPTDLMVPYAHPGATLPAWQVAASALALLALTALAIKLARRAPYVTVGWVWFLVTLIPVIGLVQVGVQSMADRYTYIPLIGLFIVVGWGIPDLLHGLAPAFIRRALAALVVVVLFLVAYPVVGHWRDSRALFSHGVKACPASGDAHFNLGMALEAEGDMAGAAREYRTAIRLRHGIAEAHYNLGNILMHSGRTQQALAEFEETLKVFPGHAQAHNNIGTILANRGKLEQAIAHFSKAAELDPSDPNIANNLQTARTLLRDRPR